jgi:hypothetical protein
MARRLRMLAHMNRMFRALWIAERLFWVWYCSRFRARSTSRSQQKKIGERFVRSVSISYETLSILGFSVRPMYGRINNKGDTG